MDLGATGVWGAACVWGVLTAATCIAILWYRAELVRYADTRLKRFFEGILLFGLALLASILVESVGFSDIFNGKGTVSLTHISTLGAVLWVYCGAQTFVVVHADHAEISRSVLGQELEAARCERDFFMLLNEVFLRVLSLKRKRLLKAAAAKEIFDPVAQQQIHTLVHMCHEIAKTIVSDACVDPREGKKPIWVRVAYFCPTEDGLRLEASHNGTDSDVVTTHQNSFEDPYAWNSPKDCLARNVAKEGIRRLVPNTDEADKDPHHPFRFFSAEQRKYLKSVAALPLKVQGESLERYPVLTIDTNQDGAFDPNDERLTLRLDELVRNLAYRLQIETAIQRMRNGITES